MSKTKTKTKGPCAVCGRIIKLNAPANVGGRCANVTRCSERAARTPAVPITPAERSAKCRAAALTQWEGKERVPYRSIRLSARAVDMIRAAAARDNCSASAVVTSSLACAEYYADLWKEHGQNNR